MFKKIKIMSIVALLSPILTSECYAFNASLKVTNYTKQPIYWGLRQPFSTTDAFHGEIPAAKDDKTPGTGEGPVKAKEFEFTLCVSAENYPGCFIHEAYDHTFNVECRYYEGHTINCLKVEK